MVGRTQTVIDSDHEINFILNRILKMAKDCVTSLLVKFILCGTLCTNCENSDEKINRKMHIIYAYITLHSAHKYIYLLFIYVRTFTPRNFHKYLSALQWMKNIPICDTKYIEIKFTLLK